MELVVRSPPGKASIWDCFLMKGSSALATFGVGGALREVPMAFAAGTFRAPVPDDALTVDLTIRTAFRHNGKDYPLLQLKQRFQPTTDGGRVTGLVAAHWQKVIPGQASGLTKIVPPLHPLLVQNGNVIDLALEFVDITALFSDLHGDTPWFGVLNLLAGTARTIRVLAAPRGNPLLWYVVIPNVVAAQPEIRPNLLYFPADYGGVGYAQDRVEGLTTANHDTSIGNVQCGGETLFSFLTRPLADSDYARKIGPYLALTQRYEKRPGRKPPPLHRLRQALSFEVTGGRLVPKYWDVPFGFEDALERHRQILLVPQVNGGDVGFAKAGGLKSVVDSAINTIYTGGTTLSYDKLEIKPLVLTCYSQSGGNVFSAARANPRDVRALVCFEPQYMNAHLKDEDKSLALGKDVIPGLLRDGRKVAIVARRKQGWEGKYLPTGVRPGDLILLPDDANYFLLDYPEPSRPYDPYRSPVLARRYSRLLKGAADPVLDIILGSDGPDADLASARQEAQVEEVIARLRSRGLSDEQLVKAVFTGEFNVDQSGGYFTHNFIVAGGQPGPDGATLGFFDLALGRIG